MRDLSEEEHRHRGLKLGLLVTLVIAIIALFFPLHNGQSNLERVIDQKIEQSTKLNQAPEQKTVYVDGTKVIQVSEGNKITNLTTNQNISNIIGGEPLNVDMLSNLSCTNNQLIKWNGTTWICADDLDTDTDKQELSLVANQLSIENGNSVDLSSLLDNTDLLASISCLAGELTKFDGMAWICASDNNTATTYTSGDGLNLSGTQFSVNAPNCSPQEKLAWDGTAFGCLTDADTDDQLLSWNSATRELSLTDGGSVTISDTDTNTTYSSGTGLSLVGTQFNLDPGNLSAVSSVANSDVIVLGTSTGPQKITYNDLFGNVLGALNYRGTWDASSNTPDLTTYCDSSTKGHYYVVAGAGNTNLGGFTGWDNNDWVICDGSGWQKIESTNSVNSVFGRAGTITAQNGDYNAGQITFAPSGTLSSTNVQSAIEELRNEVISSTLPNGQIWIGNGSNHASPVSINGDASISNTGSIVISSGAISTGKIADGTIQTVDLADSSITSAKIADSTITSSDLQNSSVDTTKILNNTINFVDLADLMSLDATTTINLGTSDLLFNMNNSGDFKVIKSGTPLLTISDDSKFLFQGSSNQVDSFKVASSSGTPQFQIDTINSNIYIGNPTADTLGTLLVLDNKTNATEPTGINGAMYYNSFSNKFRCYQNGAWTDCISSSGNAYTAGLGVSVSGSNVISSTLGNDIVSGEIVDGTITTADIANDAITSGKILDGTIVSADIADGTVTFADLASSGCTAGQIPQYSGSTWTCFTPNTTGIAKFYNNTSQTSVTAGTNVALNTLEASNIPSYVSNASGVITLKPGTYSLEGSVGGLDDTGSGNSRIWSGFYNITAGAYIGEGGHAASGNAINWSGAPYNSADATLTVTSDTQVVLRINFNNFASAISYQSEYTDARLGRAWVKVVKH